mgnify:CR=1 FL=1
MKPVFAAARNASANRVIYSDGEDERVAKVDWDRVERELDGLCRSRGNVELGHQLRALALFEARRARHLLAAGDPLVRSLRGHARVLVAGFVAGLLMN